MNSRIWDSQIGVEVVTSSSISLQELHVDGDTVFWTESRQFENGRNVLMQSERGRAPKEVLPEVHVKTKVHEYGGGAFLVEKGLLIFCDEKKNSLNIRRADGQITCLAEDPFKRWADFSFSPDLQKVICVCEDHSQKEVRNYVVLFNLESGASEIVHQKNDFYASPKWSPNGETIAFLSWNFPSMPWEECTLYGVSTKGYGESFSVGNKKESVSQFLWINGEEMVFVSDRSGFANLYLWKEKKETLLYEIKADFASPLWILGRKNFQRFVWKGKEALVCIYSKEGIDHLAILEIAAKKLHTLETPYQVLYTLDANQEGAYFIGGGETKPLSLGYLNARTLEVKEIVKSAEVPELLREFISKPKQVSTRSSLDQKEVFGFFYAPTNPDHVLETAPPLIIKCHSGPTRHIGPLLNWEVQFWTSKGFAWLDVNYRGSTGFGREYQEALNQNWGIIDVQDCLDLASALAERGQVDKRAFFAKGGSSGGFTALCMAAQSDQLRGCISSYGVTNLVALTQETHKFEKYYLDSLVGSFEKFPERYERRSPIYSADRIKCPVLFLHGDRDTVVPISQAKQLQDKLVNAQLKVFPGEGHGFCQASTIRACMEAELAFYQENLPKG